MKRLRRLSRSRDFRVIVVYLAPNKPAEMKEAMLLAEELGFRTVDIGALFKRYILEQGFESYHASPLAVSETNGHPSALASRMAARELFAVIDPWFPDGAS